MAQIEFENLLRHTMGLDTASIGSAAVERAVRTRMAQVGVMQPEDYLRRLQDSNEELQELVEGVVVPETWFFRDAQAFTALGRLLMETPRPAVPGGAPIRMLSVPCSTGEEPYSIVMSLLDAGFSPRNFHLDAVDISARSLARARNGVYGDNSFRASDLAFRNRYFQSAAHGYALTEQVRSHVNFHQKNLLAPDFGLQEESYDVIFCRNLLIYFDRSTQKRALAALERLLTPQGLLFVGPAEAFLASGSGFTSVNMAMSFAFRKTVIKSVRSAIPAPVHGRTAQVQTVVRYRAAAAPKLAPMSVSPTHSVTSNTPSVVPAGDLLTARRMADGGMLREAAALCEANLAAQGASPEAYYILGLVRDADGDFESAGACYRKAIYLAPDHEEALTHLALMKEAQGDLDAARRLHERARRIAVTPVGGNR